MSAVIAPSRSLDQRMAALAHANRIRVDRAIVKRAVRDGERAVRPLILDPPPCVQSMKVDQLLLAIPKFGAVKVNVILRTLAISHSKTVGGLSMRQRGTLDKALRELEVD